MMSRTALLAAAVAGALSFGSLSARADDISDGLAKAAQLYAAGDLAGAQKEIGFASTAIAQQLNEAYGATFPEAPAGWTSSEASAESMAMMGMGQTVSRTYTDSAGGGTVTLSLVADSPMLQSLGMIFANPMMAAQAGFQRVRIGSEDAMMQADKSSGTTQIMLVLAGGRLLLQAEGSNGVPADAVKALMSAWKIDQVKKLAGL